MLRLLLVLLHLTHIHVSAYSSGAPTSVCNTMLPGHPAPPQSTVSTVNISTSVDKCYTAGKPLKLNIVAPSGEDFKGFLVVAKSVPPTDDSFIGSFTVESNVATQLIQCGTIANSAVTHPNSNTKTSVSFSWNPPSNPPDQVTFRMTVVKGFITFWTKVDTVVSLCSSATSAAPASSTKPGTGTYSSGTKAATIAATTAATTAAKTAATTAVSGNKPVAPSGSLKTSQISFFYFAMFLSLAVYASR